MAALKHSRNLALTIDAAAITHVRSVTMSHTAGVDAIATGDTNNWQNKTPAPNTASGSIELGYDATHAAQIYPGTIGVLVVTWDTGDTETLTVVFTGLTPVASVETGAWIRETATFEVAQAPA